jgi:hypothetical protein
VVCVEHQEGVERLNGPGVEGLELSNSRTVN